MEPPPIPASLAALVQGSPVIHPSGKGKVFLWEPARAILVTRVIGVLTADGALAIETAARRSIARHGPQLAFHDWEAMTDYEADARTQLTKFGVDARKSFDSVHMLVRSKLVQFGVQAANLVVRTIRVYTERTPFEAALRRAISEKQR